MAKKKLENKKNLQELQKDLEDLQRYIEEFTSFLPIAVCEITPIGIIISINKAFQGLTGYREIDIIGKPIIFIFLEKEETEKIIDEMFKQEVVREKELTLLSKEKKEIPVNLTGSQKKDEKGNIIGYFISLIGIAEVKKFREELEEKIKERTGELEKSGIALMNILEDVEEARKRTEEEKNKTLDIITNFADGLLVFDSENKLSLINPQAEDFFDVKKKDIIGRSILELSTFSALEPLLTLAGKEIKEVFRKELLIKEKLTIEVSTVPMIRGEEKMGTLIILHDVTREKIVERMKTEFVSLVAHQLRTPLSAIKWTLRMVLDGDLGPITEEQRDFMEKTYKSNERMIILINDLLDITRIEEGRYLFKPVLTDIESVVQFVLNSYKKVIEKRELKLEFKKPEKKLPRVILDVEKIKLAINNLVDNAIKYTVPGGEVTISLNYNKKEIEFSIKDTGVGIPEDQQERVFSKFFRGTNVLRMETEGTGLGLFIAKNIIEAHAGKIWFESKKRKGTTFYFTLPVEK